MFKSLSRTMASKRGEIPFATREKVVQLRDHGNSYRKIASELKISCAAVCGILKKNEETGTVSNKPRTGRPSKLTCRQKRQVVRKALKDPKVSAQMIATDIATTSGTVVTPQTVRNILHSEGIKGRRPRKKPLLNEINRSKISFFSTARQLSDMESDEPVQNNEDEAGENGAEDTQELVVLDPDATDVDLNHCRIAKIENMEQLSKVETICLRQNLIKKIENLENLTTLVELELYDNLLTKIENLSTLVNLQVLDLSFNRISKIENLGSLVQLKKLYLVNNKITEITNLNHLVNLEMLELGSNKIRVINNIEGLVNLKSLFLGKNKITTLQNLDTLVNLEVLSIQSNRIIKITGLDKLTNLDQLYLSHNGIQEIEGLENNINLQTLDIASNRIKKIANISQLTNLEEFWFNNNEISDWNDLDQLKILPKLTVVYLEGNPLQKDPMYRPKVKAAIPNLQQIDATLCR